MHSTRTVIVRISSHRAVVPFVSTLLGLAACASSRSVALHSRTTLSAVLEVDHAQIYVSPGAPEAAVLQRAGLLVGATTTRHTGQGTAARFVPFDNGYLELIWMDSSVSVASAMREEVVIRRQRAAWRFTGAAPIGVGLRRHRGIDDSLPLPLPARPYAPEWVRAGAPILRLTDALDPAVPVLFVVPNYMVRDSAVIAERMARDASYAARLAHPLGVRRLTRIRLMLPTRSRSEGVDALVHGDVFDLSSSESPVLELTFDYGHQRLRDFRPDLPLIIRY